MQKVLVIQTAFLGDVILATPVFSELRRLFPSALIHALVKKGNETLLQNHQDINETFVFDKSSGKFKNIFKLGKIFKQQQYDLVINLHRHSSSALIAKLASPKNIYGFKKNPLSFLYDKKFPHNIGDGTHEVERNLSVIASLGAESHVRPSLYPTTENNEKIAIYTQEPFICIAPASVWFTKQLPEHKWVELLQTITIKTYLIGAPADFQLCHTILEKAQANQLYTETQFPKPTIENLAGKLSLMESVALIQQAQHLHANDSGPIHMASAVNTPTTAYFCSTIPAFGFTPLADKSTIAQIDFPLECRPCGVHGYKSCPKGHFKCSEIKVG